MTEIAEAPKRETERTDPEFVDQKIERALLAIAAFNGNTRKASEFLKSEDKYEVPHQTLWRWSREKYAARYTEIRAEVLPRIREQAADEHMDLAARQMEVNGELVDRLKENVSAIDPKDLAGAIRNLSVSAAVETEKAQLLNDQPTERRSVDLSGALKELKSMGVDPKVVLDLEPASEEDVSGSDGVGHEVELSRAVATSGQ